MNCPDMNEMASAIGEDTERYITEVQKMVREEKQHLASTFQCLLQINNA